MKIKALFLSDVHLGTRGCKADILCAFLKQTPCDRIYLIGDIVDGWQLHRRWYWPQSHSNVIRRLLTKAKRGTEVIWVLGNHDEFLRPWLRLRIAFGNLKIVNQITHESHGRKFLVVHGDLFDGVTRYHKWISVLGDQAYNFLVSANSVFNDVRQRLGYGYWSLSQYLKERTKQAVDFIFKFEENLVHYAKKRDFDGVICGHIHTPAIKHIDGLVYMNDGDFVENCSAIIEDEYGHFHLVKVDHSGAYSIVKTLWNRRD